ncbi:primosomal protein N' [Geotalea uraniireducens]|uniref:Replication restart protein PriA n=1 Tax=Geotalea uraniireducens TaxID=351604 RepID=A0ABM8EQL6_9BACT|nr:primosomal protein N' [Geotalea uraniireducens]BDV44741.1 primosomal protein N' [Geotalea uraniireducens]
MKCRLNGAEAMSNPLSIIIEVAVPLPLDSTFHYRVPASLARQAELGRRVLVPFGKRKVTAYVLGHAATSEHQLVDILDVLDEQPLFTPQELKFYRWAAAYYLHPLGEILKAALPAGINQQSGRKGAAVTPGTAPAELLTGGQRIKTETVYRLTPGATVERSPRGKAALLLDHFRTGGEYSATELRRLFADCTAPLRRLAELGLVHSRQREVYRDPFKDVIFDRDAPLPLNPEQSAALHQISDAMAAGRFQPFLLFGVTGSGKTEVYLQAIAQLLPLGKTALVLVPEIALTPQLVNRFKRRFDCGIAVLHSGLSTGERYDEWRRIRRGEVSIVIGARSAIFAPLERLGIIVVDEEHEGSYKQNEGFRYNARDLALVRGKMAHACVVLGSATPQVTTWHAAHAGQVTVLPLPHRVNGQPLPRAEIIDMRQRRGELIMPPLAAALTDNLAAGGQSLLFLNRRGFATWLTCAECGQVLRCPNCAVTLTYHQRRNRHCCHYCDYSIPAPSVCPACNGPVTHFGIGTEQVEARLRELFPAARIDRMDRDTTSGKGSHSRILQRVAERQTDILIGTQMVAKGHDFPGITLVGILSVESTLNIPDFRSAERTFQLITQLMGRAGRGSEPGKVMVQSLNPEHYALTFSCGSEIDGFYRCEVDFRREAGYPPFAFLAALYLTGTAGEAVEREARLAADKLLAVRRRAGTRLEILGPAPAPLAKLRGRFRWQILLKSRNRTELHHLLVDFRSAYLAPAGIRLQIDVDPADLM